MKRFSLFLSLLSGLAIAIAFSMAIFTSPTTAEFIPDTPIEASFLKLADEDRSTKNLRAHYLADLEKQGKYLQIRLINDPPLSTPVTNANKHTIGKQLDFTKDIIVTEFPIIRINERDVYLMPETNLTVKEILENNKFLIDELNAIWSKELGGSAICIDEETAYNQENLNFILVCFPNDTEKTIDRKKVANIIDQLSLANNAKINNQVLKAIYSKNYGQFDSIAPIAPDYEHAIFYDENIKSSPYSKEELEKLDIERKQAISASQPTSIYNRWKAVLYALNWWYRTNNIDYPFYARYFGQDISRTDYNWLPYDGSQGQNQSIPARGWFDCTNFVSQALSEGGLLRGEHWYYSNVRPSHSWGGTQDFYKAFSKRFGTTSVQNTTVGDVIQAVNKNTGEVIHTMLITQDRGHNIIDKYVTYHSKDRMNINANRLFNMFNEPIYLYCYHIT